MRFRVRTKGQQISNDSVAGNVSAKCENFSLDSFHSPDRN